MSDSDKFVISQEQVSVTSGRSLTRCCCFCWLMRCSHCGTRSDILRITCTHLFSTFCISSSVGCTKENYINHVVMFIYMTPRDH